uniref:Ribonuclease H-like domain-containing protein n=1 Tax=Tanacetum cinerariifolium TaxID=118510 RepID=A0A6L2JVN0_TANCI|nr:ribonuclease H-like domain-containing protein [Tanacetum cinerariifolium]
MHNNIMAAGSKDRPPMLATKRYPQWQSRFLRYVDTKLNGVALMKCILEGPYIPTSVIIPAELATENSPAIPERTAIEIVSTMSPDNKAHFEAEKEAIHLLLTGIGDEIYSTVDACKTAHEINKNADATPRYRNDNKSRQFGSQRRVNVVRDRENVQHDDEYNVFANVRQHSEQSKSTSNTCLVEKDDSVVTPDSPNMCDNDIQTDQNAEDEHAALANLIANLKLDVDENKKIQKKLKKANASLAHELEERKSILAKNRKTLEESNSIRDSCLVALQNKQTDFEKYKAFNDRTVDYDKLESPKGPTFNGKPTFANPKYLKMAQSEKPSLYVIPNDQSDPTDRLVPDREETLTLAEESRSKLYKDFVQPFDYTKLNSLYEIFKPASQGNHEQLANANEIRKKNVEKMFCES